MDERQAVGQARLVQAALRTVLGGRRYAYVVVVETDDGKSYLILRQVEPFGRAGVMPPAKMAVMSRDMAACADQMATALSAVGSKNENEFLSALQRITDPRPRLTAKGE